MQLTAGTRLRSQVCSTQVIVVKAPAGDVKLSCGGADLVSVDADVLVTGAPAPGLDTGTQIGKRYAQADGDLELLVTKAGIGALAVGDDVLAIKRVKPLPASD